MNATEHPMIWELPDFWQNFAGASIALIFASCAVVWFLTVSLEYLERGSEPLQEWELSGDRILVRCSRKGGIRGIEVGLEDRSNDLPWKRYEAVYAASGLKLANARTVPAIGEKLTELGAVRVPLHLADARES